MKILSIQSWVSHGHAGNAAAVFPLQRLGAEVVAVHTVLFSNHTGYGAWRGAVVDPSLVREVVAGVEERGSLADTDALLTGYLGDAAIGEAVLEAHARLTRANPRALWCCDPVIGDVGRGVFVRPGIPEFFRDRCVPAADILTPNHFELDWLTGGETRTLPALCRAARGLLARGPKRILVTSLTVEDTPAEAIDVVALDAAEAYRVRIPRLPIVGRGTGDVIAALFLAHTLAGLPVAEGLARAVSSLHGVLAATVAAGREEMALVAAQAELVAPSRLFTPERLA
ncbi:pyridoxal kinase PdxY [Elioraea sp. Yellowstone]|jgi:pyridoxine kinase|uniref:pyridoxal kinase PdxY n=1 Tax=Elioraea sp. Yellowstone TaxID=2592070 RepID=UPI00114D76CD|nr:pyridoxal kinase PdxY [Elioraea sp. Yellowstone]TQF80520.1 pyridoxal kinase PdxY [Elioraea sp. Yellowstone]